MKKRILKLKIAFAFPGIISAIRILLTMFVLVYNPLDMPLRFIQVVPMFVVMWNLVSYYILYTDSTPVIPLLLPTIIHFVIILVMTKVVILVPFIPFLVVDFVYIIIKYIKSSMFPFEMEGDEDDNLLDEFEEAVS